MQKKITGTLGALLAIITISLAGCGGGSSNGPSTVNGVAAVGSPLAGTAYLKDASTPAKELSVPLQNDGSFTFDVTGMQGPFIMQATGTVAAAPGTTYTMYSFATGPGTANINPISNVAVAAAAGGTDPAVDFDSPSQAMLQDMATKMPAAIAALKTSLKPLLSQYAVTADPISGPFVANHTGLDAMFDAVTMGYSSGMVTVMNTSTKAVIFTGQSTNMSSGTFTMSNMPLAPTPASPTTPTTPTTPMTPTAPTTSTTPTTPMTPPMTAFDGAAYYTANCAGCHGVLATSQKRGATVAQIQAGIAGVSGMSSFSSLTAAQIQAVATALAPVSMPASTPTTTPTTIPTTTPATTPMPTPMPTFDALSYYNSTCLGCHGSLGVRTAAQIQAAINSNRGGMGSLVLTATQVAAIAAVSH